MNSSALPRRRTTGPSGKFPSTSPFMEKPATPFHLRTEAMKIFVNEESGYEVQLDIHLSRGIEPEQVKAAATSALVYERGFRGRSPKDADTPFFVPPWLVDGLREATAWRLNQSDRRLYEALFKTGGLFKIDDLFSTDEQEFEDMDGAMRAAFRVSMRLPGHGLAPAAAGQGWFPQVSRRSWPLRREMPALLRKHFPELNLSEVSLAKWWCAPARPRSVPAPHHRHPARPGQTETAARRGTATGFPRPRRAASSSKSEITFGPRSPRLPSAERGNAVRSPRAPSSASATAASPPTGRILARVSDHSSAPSPKTKPKAPAAKLTDLAERRTAHDGKNPVPATTLTGLKSPVPVRPAVFSTTTSSSRSTSKPIRIRRTDEMPTSKYLGHMDALFTRKGDTAIQPDLPAPSQELPLDLPPLEHTK